MPNSTIRIHLTRDKQFQPVCTVLYTHDFFMAIYKIHLSISLRSLNSLHVQVTQELSPLSLFLPSRQCCFITVTRARAKGARREQSIHLVSPLLGSCGAGEGQSEAEGYQSHCLLDLCHFMFSFSEVSLSSSFFISRLSFWHSYPLSSPLPLVLCAFLTLSMPTSSSLSFLALPSDLCVFWFNVTSMPQCSSAASIQVTFIFLWHRQLKCCLEILRFNESHAACTSAKPWLCSTHHLYQGRNNDIFHWQSYRQHEWSVLIFDAEHWSYRRTSKNHERKLGNVAYIRWILITAMHLVEGLCSKGSFMPNSNMIFFFLACKWILFG